MKILFITTPIRPVPTQFPPFGTLSLISYLRNNGIINIDFYNIDANRPDYKTALNFIIKNKPKILAISSVVSTAYSYTKSISLDVKKSLPNITIIQGGNLAASSEVILRNTGVDFCVLGEGEKVLLNLVNRLKTTTVHDHFHDVAGLMYINNNNLLINTGYESPLKNDELYDVNWDDLVNSLDKNEDIDRFIYDPYSKNSNRMIDWFRFDERSYLSGRTGKKVGQLPGAKGCVARCSFCHRWDKGIRYIPVNIIMKRLDHLINSHNVGFLTIIDENFGTSKKWLHEFCKMISSKDILWSVTGMRVNCVNEKTIQMMKDSGCTSILYGMETGSKNILEIMEKRVKIEDNYNALKWTIASGLHTVVQLVIGMPGESPSTIDETILFAKEGMSLSPTQNPNWLSINYAQALPGTPLYEYARHCGLIGTSFMDEEEYLIKISDQNAANEFTSINFTDYPKLVRDSWRPRIQLYVNYWYVKKYGSKHYHKILSRDFDNNDEINRDQGYFNKPKKDISHVTLSISDENDSTQSFWESSINDNLPSLFSLLFSKRFGLAYLCYPLFFYKFRKLLLLMILAREYKNNGFLFTIELINEYLKFIFLPKQNKNYLLKIKPLRKLLRDDLPPLSNENIAMNSLRKGR